MAAADSLAEVRLQKLKEEISRRKQLRQLEAVGKTNAGQREADSPVPDTYHNKLLKAYERTSALKSASSVGGLTKTLESEKRQKPSNAASVSVYQSLLLEPTKKGKKTVKKVESATVKDVFTDEKMEKSINLIKNKKNSYKRGSVDSFDTDKRQTASNAVSFSVDVSPLNSEPPTKLRKTSKKMEISLVKDVSEDEGNEKSSIPQKRKKESSSASDVSSHSTKCVEEPKDKNIGLEKSVCEASSEPKEDTMVDENDNPAEQPRQDFVAGFTVLGNFKHKENLPIKTKLPDWLQNPLLIKQRRFSKTNEDGCEAMKLLCSHLKDKLRENGIHHLFPVQREFIPVIWEDLKFGILAGSRGYRPRDICVSTPTGSGKTLAFALPIVQALKDLMIPHIYAIVILPVRDLAEQVYNVFLKYCAGTGLKVGLAVGKTTFSKEQDTLVRLRYPGQYHSMVSILVATPGRLVDHIRQTPGFDLSCLRFLVIDEADKMMEMKINWMAEVESAAYTENPQAYFSLPREAPGPLTVMSSRCSGMPMYYLFSGCSNGMQQNVQFQKLLFSATLSHNPEKLEQLNLFMPYLMTSGMMSAASETVTSIPVQQDEELSGNEEVQESSIGKYTTPIGLKEYVIATTLDEKPLVLLHLLHNCKFKQVLCFTNSLETTHRLFTLVQLFGGLEVAELSSNLHPEKRKKILKKFASGKIQVVVCSDSMARGMDLPNVECVISYENPRDTSTYIHRVGRTARAEKSGTAYTLLEQKEFFHFKAQMRATLKWSNIKEVKVFQWQLEPLIVQYTKLKEDMQSQNKSRE